MELQGQEPVWLECVCCKHRKSSTTYRMGAAVDRLPGYILRHNKRADGRVLICDKCRKGLCECRTLRRRPKVLKQIACQVTWYRTLLPTMLQIEVLLHD